ncbi:glycoside hydrolase domain-containing protein [Streptomyces sp. L7]
MPSVSNAWGGAAETLEMSTADFALSQLATAAGKKSTAADSRQTRPVVAEQLQHRRRPTGGYIANRKADGSWVTGFTPGTGNGFASRAAAAQYTWMVQSTTRRASSRRWAAPTRPLARLDSFFHEADGSWAFTGSGGDKSELDNEPSVNVPYLYDYAGAPYKTQETVRAAMKQLWTTDPAGIPGNDDLGEMSSWYVFSALRHVPPGPLPRRNSPSPHRCSSASRSGARTATTSPSTRRARRLDAPYIQSLKVNGTASDRPLALPPRS